MKIAYQTQLLVTLKKVQNNLVFCPLDKGPYNYGVICKKLYILSLMKEMGLSIINNTITMSSTSNTYNLHSENNPNGIVNQHLRIIKNNDITTSTYIGTIPLIYGIPNLHKSPLKFRFITGAASSSIKPLSLLLTNILKFIRKSF